MSEQFSKIKNEELLKVVGWRGGVSHSVGCALLRLDVVATDENKKKTIDLLLDPETAEKVIADLQKSLDTLHHSN